MTGFAADWLRLREPYDLRSRDPHLLGELAAWAGGRAGLHAVDLGAGTGSACRALSRHLPRTTGWTLIENDPLLIAAGTASFGQDARISYREADLNRDLDAVFALPADLVTASALIDLVSASWLDRLAARILAGGCAAWIGLTYDGELDFAPPLAGDEDIRLAFNRDMTRDKGFGPALGAAAHEALASRLAGAGHGRLVQGNSPWLLGQEDAALTGALLAGIGAAADAPASWRRQRGAVTTGMRIGHRDLLFLP